MFQPIKSDYDVIIIGTGMGGATSGYELAKLGRKVLFIERGNSFINPNERGLGNKLGLKFSDPETRLLNGLWPTKFKGFTTFGESNTFLPLGCGVGGSTSLFGAQMERMHESDFSSNFNILNSEHNLNFERWPISFKEFKPYYNLAEKLYNVRGDPDPINTDINTNYAKSFEKNYSITYLYTKLKLLGLNPYAPHVATDFIKDCNECGGVICPHFCKNDSTKICIKPAINIYNAEIKCNTEVIKINITGKNVSSITCKDLKGNIFNVAAKVYILAAGAIHSPAILLRSNSINGLELGICNSSGMVGRNLMWHISDFIAMKPKFKVPVNDLKIKKIISFNDFYVYKGLKLGTVQSLGVPINKYYILSFLKSRISKLPIVTTYFFPDFILKFISIVAEKFASNYLLFSTILEDFPYKENRVQLNQHDIFQTEYHYTYHSELKHRAQMFRFYLKDKLSNDFNVLFLSGKNNLNLGHPCGTLRMGNNPSNSVVNINCKTHDLDNLYVSDASIFPASGGTNPSLTIAANAIRVAKIIHDELSANFK